MVKRCRWRDCWLKPTHLIWRRFRTGAGENEPAFVRDVAQFIADLRQMPLAELAQATSHNFFELFAGKAITNNARIAGVYYDNQYYDDPSKNDHGRSLSLTWCRGY